MTHPEELLAPYVDGSASPQERAAVDEHASSCARCRAEITAAAAARTALTRLPIVDAPAGLAPDLGVSTRGRVRGGAPAWYRWAGAAAVAAVMALLLTLVLPHIGNNPSRGKSAAFGDTGIATQTSPITIEIQAQDYAGTALSDLVRTQAGVPQAPNVSAAATPATVETSPQMGTLMQATDAQACIKTAFKKVPGSLVRLISARFAGVPAYIGIYEQGPAGQPADTLVARAAAVNSCTILSFATARLAP